MYDYTIDWGLSWRDCPFYTITKDGVKVASGIGGEESAQVKIDELIKLELLGD